MRLLYWSVAIAAITLLIAIQFRSTRELDNRTDKLYQQLSNSHGLALKLTRKIGYGGLIHNFKNHLLRPTEPQYYLHAEADAREATDLANQLEAASAVIGIESTLADTHAMIEAYRTRLDLIRQRYEGGGDVSSIDQELRFDDTFAIREIDDLALNLSAAVATQISQLESQARTVSGIGVGGTVLLAGLLLAMFVNQQLKRQHLNAMEQVNQKLERKNRELSSANESLQQFAGIVSHDLKTPLRHIGYFNDLIAEERVDLDKITGHTEKIGDAALRMQRMIASLLEFTRTGFAQPALQEVDLEELFPLAISEIQSSIERAGASINLQLAGRVVADPELLKRVIHNLLGNSLKYAHSERVPQIDIVAESEGADIKVSVSDNGIGIDPKFAQRIFEPWQRLHSSRSGYEGEGIGLSLVKSVIEAHGGKVWLDTDYTGGSRIEFQLAAA